MIGDLLSQVFVSNIRMIKAIYIYIYIYIFFWEKFCAKHGTAMGPKNACSYADLAMGLIDEKAKFWRCYETHVVVAI